MPSNPRRVCGVAALLAVAVGTAPRAEAQVRVSLAVGVVASSDLVRDSLVRSVAVRPAPAPVVALTLDVPLDTLYRLGVRVSASHGDLELHGDSTSTVTPLTVWEPALQLARRLTSHFAAHASLGILLYHASKPEATLFHDGATPEPTFGLGFDGHWPLSDHLGVGASLDYGVHRFSTPALSASGFAGASTVHRVSLTIRLIRGAR